MHVLEICIKYFCVIHSGVYVLIQTMILTLIQESKDTKLYYNAKTNIPVFFIA